MGATNGLNCYYCYYTSGCQDPFKLYSGSIYLVTCYSNATVCAKVVLTGGSTARGCSTSCSQGTTTSGTVSCCASDYCSSSVRYSGMLPYVILPAIASLFTQARLIG
ncbi:unnamed protein product [Rotaria magnacalcarata]|uniref:Snake toxin/toxin-like domain-containing protein n=1 Tax=Rotaria magnacalcarata TaxID=392030 RepID=A0A816RLQ1_9BILA|nr:unnamed protein product [Rotaria magnacalcarata]